MPMQRTRVLARLTGFYRARISGRGPLRAVRCTFERTETCGAYGHRVASSEPPLRAALWIGVRLRRCGHLALYRDVERDTWLWHADHERSDPAQLDAALDRARELPSTRAAVLRANALVGRECGDPVRVAGCADGLRALRDDLALDDPHGHERPAQLLVRGLGAWFAKARRRRAIGLAIAALIGTLALGLGLIGWFFAAAACVTFAIVLAARAAHRHARDVRRAEGFIASALFSRPS